MGMCTDILIKLIWKKVLKKKVLVVDWKVDQSVLWFFKADLRSDLHSYIHNALKRNTLTIINNRNPRLFLRHFFVIEMYITFVSSFAGLLYVFSYWNTVLWLSPASLSCICLMEMCLLYTWIYLYYLLSCLNCDYVTPVWNKI